MRDLLIFGTGLAAGFYAFLLWLAIAGIRAARRAADINDAPCLVCREHACICGE